MLVAVAVLELVIGILLLVAVAVDTLLLVVVGNQLAELAEGVDTQVVGNHLEAAGGIHFVG